MKHGVAVRTHRPQVFHRVDHVTRTNLREWDDVMHVDESISDGTIRLRKVEPAYLAARTVVVDAIFTGCQIALEPIHLYGASCTFVVLFAGELFGKRPSRDLFRDHQLASLKDAKTLRSQAPPEVPGTKRASEKMANGETYDHFRRITTAVVENVICRRIAEFVLHPAVEIPAPPKKRFAPHSLHHPIYAPRLHHFPT